MGRSRRGWWAFALTASGFVWALAIVPTAFLLPVYGETVTNALPSGAGPSVNGTEHGSATLIAVNGASPRLLIVLALPALFAGIAWLALHRTCARGSGTARSVAASAIGLLAALILLTGFSIGAEILPVLVLLLIARALTPAGPLT